MFFTLKKRLNNHFALLKWDKTILLVSESRPEKWQILGSTSNKNANKQESPELRNNRNQSLEKKERVIKLFFFVRAIKI